MEYLKQNPMYKYLMILVIAANAGLQGWVAIYTNFAKDVVGVDGFQIGVSQSVREIPGFLTFLVIYILLVVREHRLSAWAVVLLGFGISLTGFFTSFTGLLFTTFTMSVGFHYFETTNKSLTVQYFTPMESATVFARLRGYGALANIVVGLIIWGMSFVFPYKVNFLVLGVFIVATGLYMLRIDPIKTEVPHQTKKLILKKRYWLYYVLNFLGGARRQIFTVFAIFLLVDRYKLSVSIVAGIYVLNYALTYLFNPLISKAINQYGERVVLSLESGSLILLFLGYAFIPNVYVVIALFVIDSIFMNFAIGLNTYLQKTADKQDLGSLTAVGFTINHISAVFIPLFGGVMWMLNWRLPFIIGTVLTFICLGFTQLIKTSYHEKGKIILSSNS